MYLCKLLLTEYPPYKTTAGPTVLDFPKHASEQVGDLRREAWYQNLRVIHAAFAFRMPPKIHLYTPVSSSG